MRHPPPSSHQYSDASADEVEEELICSQTDFTLPTTPSPSTPSTALTSSWDILQHQSSGADVQQLRALEGRVWSRSDITRPFVAIKLAIDSSALCNQAPNTETLETIINAIIASCPLKFPIDRVAILSFERAIKTRSSGNIYLSYAFLSPRSSNPHNHPPTTINTSRRHIELLQAFLHSNLDQPPSCCTTLQSIHPLHQQHG